MYGGPSLVAAPALNEVKAIHDLTSLLRHIDDKGELNDLLENEGQLNDIISDNEEVCCLVCVYIMYGFVFLSMPQDLMARFLEISLTRKAIDLSFIIQARS